MKEDNAVILPINGKRIQIFRSRREAPLVIYHAVRGEGKDLWEACRELCCPDFSLAVVNDINWDDEMSPWPIPPIAEDDTPCSGGADVYLDRLLHDMLPQIIAELPEPPTFCALAGYSLAGLFSVYTAYKTDRFSHIASASGSLWYPDFVSYACQNQISESVKAIYLSLGDKESRTGNPYLAPVEDNTRVLARHFSRNGIKTVFQLNKGNHYQNATGRMANGIQWMLRQ